MVPHAAPIITATVDFVKVALAGNDASHDWDHIERVWRLTRTLATREMERAGPEAVDVEVAELAALLHDIADWKYSNSETEGVERAAAWLKSQGYDAARSARVLHIVENVSFHTELGKKRKTDAEGAPEEAPCLELQVVQDADRLDAVGAIGIARCFTYGGHKKRKLYDLSNGGSIYRAESERADTLMSKEDYMGKGKKEDTVEHFYEKLLHLRGLMKTKAGAAIADGRHQFMETYLKQLDLEVGGER
eukprot:COSAG02_NODE_1889_length_10492_cov_3.218128_1_plen_248_part_00